MTTSVRNTGEENQLAPLRLIACPHLFSVEKDRLDVQRPAGGSVSDLMRSIGWTPEGLSARVYLDGELVQDAAWEYTMPRAGQSLVVRAVPMGGGGDGKDALRIVSMIAVIAAAIAVPYFAPVASGIAFGSLGGALFTAGVSIIGSLAVAALIPPAQQNLNSLSGQSTSSNTLSLTGTSNQLIPYGVVPRVYGRHRIFPPLAARHYTEIVGDDQYLRALFCLGPGPLSMSDFKIGENTVDLFTNVEIEVRQGYQTDPPHTLYPSAIIEEPLSIPITAAGGPLIRTSKELATELSLDVSFAGLFTENGRNINNATVGFRVEHRLQGATPFILSDGQPPQQATLTTTLPGAHDDLTFTEVGSGSYNANNHTISYVDDTHAGGQSPTETLSVTQNGSGFAFRIALRKMGGLFSTAAQVKAFLTSAVFYVGAGKSGVGTKYNFSSFLTVSLAPGNNGSGRVTTMGATHLSGGHLEIPAFSVTDRRVTQLRVSHAWTVTTPGIYEVRLTRLTADATDQKVHDKAFWTALRTVRGASRPMPAGLASIAVRIKATDQLNGTLDSFNCIAESILPDWEGTRWIPAPTSNPAAILRDIHQGTANARPKPDSRMDLDTIQAFHGRCAANGFAFNAVIDFRSTVSELARNVLAAGRATPSYRDGKISVVEDIPQTTPAHVLTPRNSWGFKGTKIFVDLPHALRVRFVNALTLDQDERVVLADGYGITGTDGVRRDAFGHITTLPDATIFEAVEAGQGVTDPEQIFKLQRYHLAVLALRPETYQLSCDFEHLVMLRGDLIMVQHDVPLFGLISGRIKAIGIDGIGRTSTITLDEPCVMESGQRYGVRLRLRDGTQLQREVQTVVGSQSTLTLLEPI